MKCRRKGLSGICRWRPFQNTVLSLAKTDRAFMIVREAIAKRAARCNLNRNPEMPAGFRGRTADNWPLLRLAAIADGLGFGYDEAARRRKDSPWGEWTGVDGTAAPHMLTK